MNVWRLVCSIKSSIKNTVNNTEESFKSGIPMNDIKIDITFYFWPLQKGLIVGGGLGHIITFWRLLKKQYQP